ncbi:zinc finger protein 521-like [Watersipora subatra]|uniref:zinc finger protein 521-like n=1 Tax=Watersipora subatra TaxID=2589382 RepID=UPI00355B9A83
MEVQLFKRKAIVILTDVLNQHNLQHSKCSQNNKQPASSFINKNYVCYLCKRKYPSKGGLSNHVVEHHGSSCRICGQLFSSRHAYQLSKHWREHLDEGSLKQPSEPHITEASQATIISCLQNDGDTNAQVTSQDLDNDKSESSPLNLLIVDVYSEAANETIVNCVNTLSNITSPNFSSDSQKENTMFIEESKSCDVVSASDAAVVLDDSKSPAEKPAFVLVQPPSAKVSFSIETIDSSDATHLVSFGDAQPTLHRTNPAKSVHPLDDLTCSNQSLPIMVESKPSTNSSTSNNLVFSDSSLPRKQYSAQHHQHHASSDRAGSPLAPPAVDARLMGHLYTVMCRICGCKILNNKLSLRIHCLANHKEILRAQIYARRQKLRKRLLEQQTSLPDHSTSRDDTVLLNLSCPSCAFQTTDSNQLTSHIISAHPITMKHCDRCDYQSLFEEDLEKHIKDFHALLHCKYCTIIAKTSGELAEHMDTEHYFKAGYYTL